MAEGIKWDDIKGGLEDKPVPKEPKIQIELKHEKDEDVIWLTRCVDPQFDMCLITEGLATAITAAAAYTDAKPADMLQAVINRLTESVKWHGNLKSEE